ncbi:MAG: hypothetical protein O3A46_00535 [Candidatus Poribacteria bacterium]|nr:hypothetical protein [Candidatus Poribacteria bacterium]
MHRNNLNAMIVALAVATVGAGYLAYVLDTALQNQPFALAVLLGTGVLMAATMHAVAFKIQARPAPSIHYSFNLELVSKYAESLPVQEDAVTKDEPWDIRATELAHRDSPLALAKIRMDLEKELRRLAMNRLDERLDEKQMSAGHLIRLLATNEILPVELVASLHEVISVANKAVHGQQIATSTAFEAVDVGDTLLRYLRTIPNTPETTPTTS